jgi:hypothetical protein
MDQEQSTPKAPQTLFRRSMILGTSVLTHA